MTLAQEWVLAWVEFHQVRGLAQVSVAALKEVLLAVGLLHLLDHHRLLLLAREQATEPSQHSAYATYRQLQPRQ